MFSTLATNQYVIVQGRKACYFLYKPFLIGAVHRAVSGWNEAQAPSIDQL